MRFEPFNKVFQDITSDFHKIPSKNFLSEGNYRIVDQGKEFIAGYTNAKSLITAKAFPVIGFGDHTRVLKYIDFPFAIGADGLKVLEVINSDVYPKFAYYFLKSVAMPDAGYSRHYKFLKELAIPIPESLEEQVKITAILFKVETLIKQRKESIELVDEFLRSTFLKMFGDPVKNERGWKKLPLKDFGNIITGNTPSREDKNNYSENHIEWIKTDNIREDGLFVTKAEEYLSKQGLNNSRFVENGALLVACIAGSLESIGRANLTDRRVAFNQQINAIQPNSDINPYFLYYLFRNSRPYIQSHATKGMKKILTKGEFQKIVMIKPDVNLQEQFAKTAKKAQVLNEHFETSLKELENLYGSLSQRAFKGELNLRNVVLKYELEYEGGDNDRTEPKHIDLNKVNIDVKETQNEGQIGDPFDVDEKTAKSKGKKFYRDWKHLRDRRTMKENLDLAMEYAVHPERIPKGDPNETIDWDGPDVEHFEYAGSQKEKGFTDRASEALQELLAKHPNGFSFTEFRTYLKEAKNLDGYQETKAFVFDSLEKGRLLQYFATPEYMRASENPLFNPPGGDNLRDALIWLMPVKPATQK